MRRILVATLLAAALGGCGKSETGAPAPKPAELTPAERQARLAALPAPYNSADLDHGKALFGLCRSCHTIAPGGANLTGSNLHGVFGRKAGGLEGYAYSPAVKAAGFVWSEKELDAWLTNPRTFLPGTKMVFSGFQAPKDRADVIAYLMVETAPAAP